MKYQWRRLRRHGPHQTAPRKATGPLLRPQGSLRDRYATGLRPALDPGASTAPNAQRHGQDPRPRPPQQRGADHNQQHPYKSTLYGLRG